MSPELITFLTIGISFLMFAISFINLWTSSRDNATNRGMSDAAFEAKITTKLDFISEDIKDLKAQYRATYEELKEVRYIAEKARDSAISAHTRLDHANISMNMHQEKEQS